MRFNLVSGLFWLCFGVALIVGHYAGYKQHGVDRDVTPLLGLCAIALAGWKLVRWWAARVSNRTPPVPPEPPKRRPVTPPEEYNPAFDFTRDGPKSS